MIDVKFLKSRIIFANFWLFSHFAIGLQVTIWLLIGVAGASEPSDMTPPPLDKTSLTYRLFNGAPAAVAALAQKIEQKQPISFEDITGLPEGALDKRYGQEITLLTLATAAKNADAVELLLKAGANPYLPTQPSKEKLFDFTHYLAAYSDRSDTNTGWQFNNKALQSYLKYGGKIDNQPNPKNTQKLLNTMLLFDNYDGAQILLEAKKGKIPPKELRETTFRMTMNMKSDLEMLSHLVCNGYYDKADNAQINKLLATFSKATTPPSYLRDYYQLLAMRILSKQPQITDNALTQQIFSGPIPTDLIAQKAWKAVCP